jgi:hypothetical protein
MSQNAWKVRNVKKRCLVFWVAPSIEGPGLIWKGEELLLWPTPPKGITKMDKDYNKYVMLSFFDFFFPWPCRLYVCLRIMVFAFATRMHQIRIKISDDETFAASMLAKPFSLFSGLSCLIVLGVVLPVGGLVGSCGQHFLFITWLNSFFSPSWPPRWP